MSSISLINKVSDHVIFKLIQETKHGHLLNDNDNKPEYIPLKQFFSDKKYLETCDWKWGLTKYEREFICEYYDYIHTII